METNKTARHDTLKNKQNPNVIKKNNKNNNKKNISHYITF